MRTCITPEGNCTKCCQVIGINRDHIGKHRRGKINAVDGDKILGIWNKISKRRAKKVNPYAVGVFSGDGNDWFTCKNLGENGCMDQENKPDVCSRFVANSTYSPTCEVDSRVFYRTTEV